MAYCMTESADESNLPMCKEIGESICAAYPGYSWHIRIDGGLLIIKNMSISPTAAMVRKFAAISSDAKRRKHDVVMAAGEFLEAAHLSRRGRESNGNATQLEGLSKGEKFQPISLGPIV